MILRCKCTHEHQDLRYGKGKRVHNPKAGAKGSSYQEYKCTVCGSVKSGSGAVVKPSVIR